jgi:uncharacterized membrane protein
MGQQPQVASAASPWRDPAALADLLDYLRTQGFRITADEYAVAQDLVLALIARGEDINDIASLKAFLSPVLCTNPREQTNFSAHFDRWLGRTERREPKAAERELEVAGQRWSLWSWVLAGVAVCLATTIVLVWPQPPVRPGAVDPAGFLRILIYVGLVLSLLSLAWGVWWYFSGRLFLSRRSTSEEPDLIRVDLDSGLNEYLNDGRLRRAARELRRRFAVPSSELAIALTVEQTIRNNGQFMPAFRSRLAAPEYLVIIDRKNFKDHYARYIDEMIDFLAAEQLHIERYYFDVDPRTVFAAPSKYGPAIALQDLAAKYCDFRVLLFTDCVGLFNAVSGELEAWTDSLWGWPHLGVFTPNPPETWSYREHLLSERTMIMPMTAESILQFARKINGIRVLTPRAIHLIGPVSAELAERPNRWLERGPPEPRLVEDVLQSVRRFLGEDGYFWLSACAVYPAIHFNLTMYLGTNLKNAAGEPLFSFERLASLSRLPWLRSAYMPDWLRLELVRSLSRKQNTIIREVLDRLWLSIAIGSTKAIKLEIARRHPRALTTLARSVFRRLARRSSMDSPLQDHVFASVMLGGSVDPLTVRVPRIWREFLKRRKASNADSLSLSKVAAGLCAIFGLFGGIVFYVIVKKDSFVRHWAVQAIFFGGAWIGVSILISILSALFGHLPGIGIIFYLLFALLYFVVMFGGIVLWIIGIIKAFQGKRWEYPFISELGKKYFRNLT